MTYAPRRPRTLPNRLRRAALVVPFIAALFIVGAPVPADAANLSNFDPSYLISDLVFYDASAMSVDAVQSFLVAKGANCVPAADGTACLKNYRQSTVSRAADARCTGAYAGAANETAAVIIVKVAQACGINPRVLLVTLQKEQSLVTRSRAGTAAVYQKAMGYGCPDTAACNSQYYGFFNQVYSAASQFRNYGLKPTSFSHRVGVAQTLRYHPNAICGGSTVVIRNQATANLYNYTPYQPNPAALAAGYGTGDSCSAYGNRNFWSYFTDWFGSTTSPNPVGSFDVAASVGGAGVRLAGWAIDPDTTAPVMVHVYIDGQPSGVVANQPRPDVGAAYPGWGDTHGFDVTLPAAEGVHQVCAWAINQPAGFNPLLGCRAVTVTNHAPVGFVDSVTATASSVLVSGWAIDPDATDSLQVHVYIDGQATVLRADGARADVAAAYPGQGAAHGFAAEIAAGAGTHRVCVYPINLPASANPALRCVTVTVVNASPIGALDAATGAPGSVTVEGWAIDPETSAPVQVHVYLDGRFAGSGPADVSRPDVAAAYPGQGAARGFSLAVPAAPGSHQVCVYAINQPVGFNPAVGCRAVTSS
ncbi:hypothetical protein [Pengzhenrongella sicca]|uniref:Hemagglutinin n=1 Tax=Pengzhenrongella sicca TaxID=2819238 RepID=A0A8A4ZGZ8_9MICO|nr:hypothetical protein [Pengzhenrongella sicca]QTE30233.1 hypothetical protein J4E96_04290 [Pengzhenrongella sicca]